MVTEFQIVQAVPYQEFNDLKVDTVDQLDQNVFAISIFNQLLLTTLDETPHLDQIKMRGLIQCCQ